MAFQLWPLWQLVELCHHAITVETKHTDLSALRSSICHSDLRARGSETI